MNDEGEDGDADEPSVVAEACKDVELTVTKLTCIELVEKLHEYEGLENDCVEFALLCSLVKHAIKLVCSVWVEDLFLINVFLVIVKWRVLFVNKSKQIGSEAEKDHQYDKLVKSLTKDVPPHNGIDNLLGLASWLAVHKSIIRRLSCKGKSSECVHDKVYPEHLNGGERRIVEDHRSSEDNDQSSNVDSKLELKELSDVVEDVSSVLDGNFDRAEVIISKNDICSALSDISASDTHREPDIGSVESWGVISTISSDCNSCTTVLNKSVDEHELVIWKGAGENLQLGSDALESTDILDLSCGCAIIVSANATDTLNSVILQ